MSVFDVDTAQPDPWRPEANDAVRVDNDMSYARVLKANGISCEVRFEQGDRKGRQMTVPMASICPAAPFPWNTWDFDCDKAIWRTKDGRESKSHWEVGKPTGRAPHDSEGNPASWNDDRNTWCWQPEELRPGKDSCTLCAVLHSACCYDFPLTCPTCLGACRRSRNHMQSDLRWTSRSHCNQGRRGRMAERECGRDCDHHSRQGEEFHLAPLGPG